MRDFPISWMKQFLKILQYFIVHLAVYSWQCVYFVFKIIPSQECLQIQVGFELGENGNHYSKILSQIKMFLTIVRIQRLRESSLEANLFEWTFDIWKFFAEEKIL